MFTAGVNTPVAGLIGVPTVNDHGSGVKGSSMGNTSYIGSNNHCCQSPVSYSVSAGNDNGRGWMPVLYLAGTLNICAVQLG